MVVKFSIMGFHTHAIMPEYILRSYPMEKELLSEDSWQVPSCRRTGQDNNSILMG